MDDYFPLHKESGLGANIDKNLTSVVALRTNVWYICATVDPRYRSELFSLVMNILIITLFTENPLHVSDRFKYFSTVLNVLRICGLTK